MSEGEIRVVCGALVRDGQVLAVRRGAGGSAAFRWELPGGKVEEGEDDRVALARELQEELQLDVTVGAYLEEHVHRYPTVTVRLVAYACRDREAPTGPVLTEHTGARWLGRDALHEDRDWAPADVPLLDAVAILLR
ncbi:MAG: (deoxy)nucleoside triphosphate pyrophosphohydrolase [Myxococcota bacterium]|nr:(deoxy)nucleoside triphosphate pyrophosphohydrolase [Myxococcota bacterium]